MPVSAPEWDGGLLTTKTGRLTKTATPGIVAGNLNKTGSNEIQPQMVALCWMELMAKPTCRHLRLPSRFFYWINKATASAVRLGTTNSAKPQRRPGWLKFVPLHLRTMVYAVVFSVICGRLLWQLP